MAFEEIIKQVAETIQREANARAVFGEPAKLDTHVVIPVASVVISISGGGGGGLRKPGVDIARLFGGGGGLNVTASPVGFIHEKDGVVAFTRIEKTKADEKTLPLVAERIMGAFASRAEKSAQKQT